MPEFSETELGFYRSAMPGGVQLKYNLKTAEYELYTNNLEGGIFLKAIPRSEVLDWTRPKRVWNHTARRALRDQGLPAEFHSKH